MNVNGSRCKRFPPEVAAYIRRSFLAGHSDRRIADKIGCSLGAIEHFRRAIGLLRRSGDIRKWPESEVAKLRDLARAGLPPGEIAIRMGRSKRAVIGQAWRLKIEIKREERRHAHQPQRDEPPVAPPKADFGALMAGRRFEDSKASLKAQPVMVFYRPATHVCQVGQLG